MQIFDASSIIYAWDNYPFEQFPPLWRWIAKQINNWRFVIPKVAYEEVQKHAPDCATWLGEHNIKSLPVTDKIAQEAVRIKQLLNIEDDNYHSKGVGENDIFIIATALIEGMALISNEGRQNKTPDLPSKMKIPAVCALKQVGVPCIDFLTLIKNSKQIFDGTTNY